jgi:ParB-like chromosome segregation protein Spo0J
VSNLVVETWPIDRLIEYARNPRKNDEHVERMAGVIREFGFRIPVVAKSDGTVVDGHLRLKAARRLGLADIPVALADNLTDAQIQAFRLLANRSASWASWDDDLLRTELMDLRDVGFDLSLTGFGEQELEQLFAPEIDRLDEWEGMPEFDADNRKAHQSVMIHFRDQSAVDSFARLIGQPIRESTRSAWFPQLEFEDIASQRFATDEPAFPDLHTV